MAANPDEFLKQLAEQGRRIRFGKGVVGKTGYATACLIGLWAIVLFRLSPNMLLNGALFAAALIATGVYCWWVRGTQNFAERNPGLALMEGAELLEYKKWEAGVKGIPGPLKGRIVPKPLLEDPDSGDKE